MIILSLLSLFNILSLSIQTDGSLEISDLFIKQLIFILAGWGIYIFLSRNNYSLLKYPQVNIILYVATIFLLLATLLWGPVINNTQRWLIFGEFQFQPAELAKLTMILFTASLFVFRSKFNEYFLLVASFAILVPILAMIYLQPHGSMSLMLLLTWAFLVFTVMKNQFRNFLFLAILLSSAIGILSILLGQVGYGLISIAILFVLLTFTFYARENWRKMIGVSTLVGLLLGIMISITWNSILLDYQKERINAFFNPTETSQDLGFNVDQSRVAIGSGRMFGKGWGFGTQSKLQFLPEYQTDFVFAAFSEEFGFIGSFVLIALYLTIISLILFYAFKSSSLSFEFVVLTGIGIKIFLEVFVNIGTNTGVIPATGVPLPLMSVGGTSILLFFFSLGLVQSIISNNVDRYKELSYSYIDNDEVLI